MMLTLTIRNPELLQGGQAAELVINKGEATIGRSSGCDWSLPDPDKIISSKHCTISFSDEAYTLTDLSTNGTFLNGSVERLPAPHTIQNGDVLQIGRYQIQAELSEETHVDAAAEAEAEAAAAAAAAEAAAAAAAAAPPPPATVAPEPVAAAPAEETLSNHTMFIPTEKLWAEVTGNDVDWDRGGFGGGGAPAATPWQPSGDAPGGEVGAAGGGDVERLVTAFIEQAGLGGREIPNRSPDMILRAARLMKLLVSGLVVMVEARARAKSQMGAEATALSFEGNNPIKFARTPEQALARLLSPPERGFMEGEPAIEDAFIDLQAHQVATLKAMQGALRTALNRFSPDAIRRRAELKGIFARILPTARDAALWQNYEREFGLVAEESDEAFLEVFAKQFRKAYEEQTLKAKETKG